jgi:hypothetical protein
VEFALRPHRVDMGVVVWQSRAVFERLCAQEYMLAHNDASDPRLVRYTYLFCYSHLLEVCRSPDVKKNMGQVHICSAQGCKLKAGDVSLHPLYPETAALASYRFKIFSTLLKVAQWLQNAQDMTHREFESSTTKDGS